ncbi:MAG: hypothetical protein KUG77_00295 [Nannocystaceae bacterium]|nr:hypothetical protein [Nannocystaceae bacterium]
MSAERTGRPTRATPAADVHPSQVEARLPAKLGDSEPVSYTHLTLPTNSRV